MNLQLCVYQAMSKAALNGVASDKGTDYRAYLINASLSIYLSNKYPVEKVLSKEEAQVLGVPAGTKWTVPQEIDDPSSIVHQDLMTEYDYEALTRDIVQTVDTVLDKRAKLKGLSNTTTLAVIMMLEQVFAWDDEVYEPFLSTKEKSELNELIARCHEELKDDKTDSATNLS